MSPSLFPTAKFRCGKIVSTPNALAHLNRKDILQGIQRHQAGDWGELCEHECAANDRAITNGIKIWSVYQTANGVQFWIITEADRSVTTVSLPDDSLGFHRKTTCLGSPEPFEQKRSDPPVRTLKIEEDGDRYKGGIRPKIRLMGQWLERAGFKPGTRVCVTCIASGILELRSDVASTNGTTHASIKQPE